MNDPANNKVANNKHVKNSPVNFLELLDIDVERYPVIAVVGGGGKTSLIYRLNQELLDLGKKVIITTTTHMAYPSRHPFARGGDPETVKKLLSEQGYAVAAEIDNNTGKLAGLSENRLRELESLCDVMLIEADGSRQLPLKVPENWEPVIPQCAGLVISVVGLDCLGKPIRQIAHRVERTAELLQKGMDAPVTPEDVVKIASSICGLCKNVEDRIYRVYLNKADVLPGKEPAEEILRGLQKQNKVAAYGSLKAGSESGMTRHKEDAK